MSTTTRYQSNFARHYFAEGEARGEARLVLTVLAARGILVPEDVREQIESCTDLDQLEVWGTRAATATKVNDLFA